MVLKAKSDTPLKMLKNVSTFSAWQMPSLELGSAPNYSQPENEQEEAQPLTEEQQAQVTADELKAIKDAAYQEGFNAGESAGLAAAKQQIDEQANLFSGLIENLAEPVKFCAENTQQQLLKLAFAIARQILRRELQQDPSQLIAIIREALTLLPVASQKVLISLHPEDASIVKKALAIDAQSESNIWQINEDPAVERGGCQVNTENSKIDASIDKQIAVLFSSIAGGQRSGESDVE